MDTRAQNRRRLRSRDQLTAIDLQLSHVASVLDLDAIVLADDLGTTISCAGDKSLADPLAAASMWAHFGAATVGRFVVDDGWLAELHARRPELRASLFATDFVTLDATQGPLALVGMGRSVVTGVGVSHAARGVARIWQS